MSVLPYALSSVCELWYDLMLLVPHFWTCLVIFVNTQLTNIADLRTRLSAFRSFVFRVHIFNRQDVIHQDIAEEARVQAVVNDLSPHSHQCEQFTFDVMHNSSLLPHTAISAGPIVLNVLDNIFKLELKCVDLPSRKRKSVMVGIFESASMIPFSRVLKEKHSKTPIPSWVSCT